METTDSGPQADWADTCEDASEEFSSRMNFSDAVKSGLLNDRNRTSSRGAGNSTGLKSNDLPRRPCSAFFKVNSAFTIGFLIQDLKAIGIMPRSLKCLQRLSGDSYMITLGSTQDRDKFVNNSSIIVRPSNPATKITVFDAPYELSDHALRHRLSQYGEVRSIKRLFHSNYEGVENGLRVASVVLSGPPVPSFMRFGRRLIRLKHDSQVPTCRKCNQPGHEARQCPNLVCFNCDAIGHVSLECDVGRKCSVCKDHGHVAASCPLLNEWSRDAPVDDRPGVSLASQSVTQESQPSAEPSAEPSVEPSVEPPSPPAPAHALSSSPGSSSSSSTSGSSSDSSSPSPPSPDLFDEPGQDVDVSSMDVQENDSPSLLAQGTTVSELEMTAAVISQPGLFSPDDPMSSAKRPADTPNCESENSSCKKKR